MPYAPTHRTLHPVAPLAPCVAQTAPAPSATFREVVGTTMIPDGPGGTPRAHTVSRVWTDPSGRMDEAQLRTAAALMDVAMASPDVTRISGTGDFSPRGTGFHLVYNVNFTNAPSGAVAAISDARVLIEQLISGPASTITIDIAFNTSVPTGPIALGNSLVEDVTYGATRSALVANIDNDDFIQNYLPSSFTTRLDDSSPTPTSVPLLDWPAPLASALITPATGSTGSLLVINSSSFAWDTDPSNGVAPGTYSLVDHVLAATLSQLGFRSGITNSGGLLMPQDLFRFSGSDRFGPGTTVPKTLQQFATFARETEGDVTTADFNMIKGSFRMAASTTTSPGYFATGAAALMVGNLGTDVTWYPLYISEADSVVLDAIGWDVEGAGMPSAARQSSSDWNKDGWPDILFDEKVTSFPGRVVSVHNAGMRFRSWTYRLAAQPGWKRVAINADLSGDQYPDMLWKNVADPTQVVYWFMHPSDPAQILTWGLLPALPSADFEVQAAGDMNNDDYADLIIRNQTTGYNAIWYLTGAGYDSWARLRN